MVQWPLQAQQEFWANGLSFALDAYQVLFKSVCRRLNLLFFAQL